MSRRSVTTISIQVRLRVPPGSNTAAVIAFVRRAIEEQKTNEVLLNADMETRDVPNPLASIDTDSMIVKLEKKETTYL